MPCDEGREPVEHPTQFCGHLNVAMTAILLVYQMRASAIFAVGMDDYVSKEPRSSERGILADLRESEHKMAYFFQ